MQTIIDLSGDAKDTVVRVVRPCNHIGRAYGGDKVRISKKELEHPAVARALWTEEEANAAIRERERRIREALKETASPQMRAADAHFEKVMEQRRQREELERKTAPLEH